jgi:hypothetical protein
MWVYTTRNVETGGMWKQVVIERNAVNTVDFRLNPEATTRLTGRVVDKETGAPLSPVRVYADLVGGNPRGVTAQTLTDTDGRYSLELSPGTWQIHMSDRINHGWRGVIAPGKALVPGEMTLDVALPRHVANSGVPRQLTEIVDPPVELDDSCSDVFLSDGTLGGYLSLRDAIDEAVNGKSDPNCDPDDPACRGAYNALRMCIGLNHPIVKRLESALMTEGAKPLTIICDEGKLQYGSIAGSIEQGLFNNTMTFYYRSRSFWIPEHNRAEIRKTLNASDLFSTVFHEFVHAGDLYSRTSPNFDQTEINAYACEFRCAHGDTYPCGTPDYSDPDEPLWNLDACAVTPENLKSFIGAGKVSRSSCPTPTNPPRGSICDINPDGVPACVPCKAIATCWGLKHDYVPEMAAMANAYREEYGYKDGVASCAARCGYDIQIDDTKADYYSCQLRTDKPVPNDQKCDGSGSSCASPKCDIVKGCSTTPDNSVCQQPESRALRPARGEEGEQEDEDGDNQQGQSCYCDLNAGCTCDDGDEADFPGGDHPDELVVPPSGLGAPDHEGAPPFLRALVFRNGWWTTLAGMLVDAGVEVVPVGSEFDPVEALDICRVLVIPSGGLTGVYGLPSVRARLRAFVEYGGTVVVLSQPWGVMYGAVTDAVEAYGWNESQSCYLGGVEVSERHAVVSSLTSLQPSVPVDGFVIPRTLGASVPLRRSAQAGEGAALVIVPEGAGRVAVSGLYPDYGYYNGQAGTSAVNMLRDIVAWGDASVELPVFERGEEVRVALNGGEQVWRVLSPDGTRVVAEGEGDTAVVPVAAGNRGGVYHVQLQTQDGWERCAVCAFAIMDLQIEPAVPDWSIAVSAVSEQIALGDPGVFRVVVSEEAGRERHVACTWEVLYNPQAGGAELFDLPAGGSHEWMITKPLVHEGWLFVTCSDGEGGEVRGSKGFFLYVPEVPVSVNAEPTVLAAGEPLHLSVTTGTQPPADRELRVRVTGPGQELMLDQVVQSHPGSLHAFDLMVPDTTVQGNVVVTAELWSAGRQLGNGSAVVAVRGARLGLVLDVEPMFDRVVAVASNSGELATQPCSLAVRVERDGVLLAEHAGLSLPALVPGASEAVEASIPVEARQFGRLTLRGELTCGPLTVLSSRTRRLSLATSGGAEDASVSAGESAHLLLSLTNTGDGDLDLDADCALENGAHAPAVPAVVHLAPGQSTVVECFLPVPADAAPGAVDAHFTARLPGGSAAGKRVPLVVPPARPAVSFPEADPVGEQSYVLGLKNVGGARLEYTLVAALDAGAGPVQVGGDSGNLAPNQETTIAVTVPGTVLVGSWDLVVSVTDIRSGRVFRFHRLGESPDVDATVRVDVTPEHALLGQAIRGTADVGAPGLALSGTLRTWVEQIVGYRLVRQDETTVPGNVELPVSMTHSEDGTRWDLLIGGTVLRRSPDGTVTATANTGIAGAIAEGPGGVYVTGPGVIRQYDHDLNFVSEATGSVAGAALGNLRAVSADDEHVAVLDATNSRVILLDGDLGFEQVVSVGTGAQGVLLRQSIPYRRVVPGWTCPCYGHGYRLQAGSGRVVLHDGRLDWLDGEDKPVAGGIPLSSLPASAESVWQVCPNEDGPPERCAPVTVASVGGLYPAPVGAVAALPDGDVALAGQCRGFGLSQHQPCVVRLAPNGDVVWGLALATKYSWNSMSDLMALPDGGLVSIGDKRMDVFEQNRPRVLRVAMDGTPVFLWEPSSVDFGGAPAYGQFVVPEGNGFVVAGQLGTTRVWSGSLDSEGTATWQWTSASDLTLKDLAGDGTGALLAGEVPGTPAQGVLVRVDAIGETWRRTWADGMLATVRRAVDGGIWVAGITGGRAFLEKLDATGLTIWTAWLGSGFTPVSLLEEGDEISVWGRKAMEPAVARVSRADGSSPSMSGLSIYRAGDPVQLAHFDASGIPLFSEQFPLTGCVVQSTYGSRVYVSEWGGNIAGATSNCLFRLDGDQAVGIVGAGCEPLTYGAVAGVSVTADGLLVADAARQVELQLDRAGDILAETPIRVPNQWSPLGVSTCDGDDVLVYGMDGRYGGRQQDIATRVCRVGRDLAERWCVSVPSASGSGCPHEPVVDAACAPDGTAMVLTGTSLVPIGTDGTAGSPVRPPDCQTTACTRVRIDPDGMPWVQSGSTLLRLDMAGTRLGSIPGVGNKAWGFDEDGLLAWVGITTGYGGRVIWYDRATQLEVRRQDLDATLYTAFDVAADPTGGLAVLQGAQVFRFAADGHEKSRTLVKTSSGQNPTTMALAGDLFFVSRMGSLQRFAPGRPALEVIETPVEVASADEAIRTREIHVDSDGSYLFLAAVSGPSGRELARAARMFSVGSGCLGIAFAPDREVYPLGPGNLQIQGVVRNTCADAVQAVQAVAYVDEIETTAFQVGPIPGGGEVPFQADLAVDFRPAEHVIQVAVDTVVATRLVQAIGDGTDPTVEVVWDVPVAVGIEPFEAGVRIRAAGRPVTGTATLVAPGRSTTAAISLAQGEAAWLRLESVEVRADTVLTLQVDGDVQGTWSAQVHFGAAASVEILSDDDIVETGPATRTYGVANVGEVAFAAQVVARVEDSVGTVLAADTLDVHLEPGDVVTGDLDFVAIPGTWLFRVHEIQLGVQATTLFTVAPRDDVLAHLSVHRESGGFRYNLALENRGIGGFGGIVYVASSGISLEWPVSLPPLSSSSFTGTFTAAGHGAGGQVLEAVVMSDDGTQAAGAIAPFFVRPPRIEASPWQNLVFAPGEVATVGINLVNTGDLPARARNRAHMQTCRSEDLIALPPGASGIASIPCLLPADAIPESSAALFELDGLDGTSVNPAALAVPYLITGTSLEVTATLDRRTYSIGDTALLDLGFRVAGEDTAIGLRITHLDFEHSQIVTATSEWQHVLVPCPVRDFDVKVGYTAQDPVTGRSLVVGYLVLNEAAAEVEVWADGDVFAQGATVPFHAKSDSGGYLVLRGPSGEDVGTELVPAVVADMSVVLPDDQPAGMAEVAYRLDEGPEYTYRLLVAGPGVIVKRLELDRFTYEPNQQGTTTALVWSSGPLAVLADLYRIDPSGYHHLANKDVYLVQGYSALSLPFAAGQLPGDGRVELWLEKDGVPIAAESRAFNVGGLWLVAKAANPQLDSGQVPVVHFQVYSESPGARLEVTDLLGTVIAQVNLEAGWSSGDVEAWTAPPASGLLRLKVRLIAAGGISVQTLVEFTYPVVLPDPITDVGSVHDVVEAFDATVTDTGRHEPPGGGCLDCGKVPGTSLWTVFFTFSLPAVATRLRKKRKKG